MVEILFFPWRGLSVVVEAEPDIPGKSYLLVLPVAAVDKELIHYSGLEGTQNLLTSLWEETT